jgi:uncharacterized protein with HEPN domain
MKDHNIYLEHILEAINRIEMYIDEFNFEEFTKDFKTQDAVIRQFEIVGEAVNKLEENFLKRHPELPWDKMVAMRNKLIHEYFGVDIEIVWQTIHKRLPELKRSIQKALEK